LDFSKEDWDVAAQVSAERDMWVIATKHHPGGIDGIEINNRTFVFRLMDEKAQLLQQADTLFVYGCGGGKTIELVRQLEEQTKTPVGWIVSNGSGHHIFLDHWFEAFPHARILVEGIRIPFTQNGMNLRKKWGERLETMSGPRPSLILEHFGNQLDLVMFDQLTHSKELPKYTWMGPNDPIRKLGLLQWFRFFNEAFKDHSVPNAECTLFHKSSKLVIGGHNFQFMYIPTNYSPKPEHKLPFNAPFPLNLMMKKMLMARGKFNSLYENEPAPFQSIAKHVQEWEMVLGWDFKDWTSSHNPPTVIGPGQAEQLHPAVLKKRIRQSLRRTGEDDPSGRSLKF
ncbi:unnamed protein product, partial [Heterosigma akashiwo]